MSPAALPESQPHPNKGKIGTTKSSCESRGFASYHERSALVPCRKPRRGDTASSSLGKVVLDILSRLFCIINFDRQPIEGLVRRNEPLISRERSASEVVWCSCHLPGTPHKTSQSGLTQDADAIALKCTNVVPPISSKNKVPSHFVRLQVSTIQIEMSCDLRQINLHLTEGHRTWDTYIHILILSDCVNASLHAPCVKSPLRLDTFTPATNDDHALVPPSATSECFHVRVFPIGRGLPTHQRDLYPCLRRATLH
ncbi:hypothetical protein EDD16DRAFT_468022 [Pisolithus croceorrhizus]|nr:hypothetical protein EDD16DRAFT_468022 [Pisolithus croceorrhizus]